MNFNPRSREGSDPAQGGNKFSQMIFQSTLPRRERPHDIRLKSVSCMISIHAPAKGATDRQDQAHMCHVDFNPRSREGSDLYNGRYVRYQQDFNPRSREGSDPC